MEKNEEYQKEASKWKELFSETDLNVQKAAEGLIEKAACVHAICKDIERAIEKSGAIKVHPQYPEVQKQVPAVKEYARLAESYANIVNKLNALRIKNITEEDDGLEEFE